ncbi:MAG TPA: hypothetical protein VES67_22430 [Vicinamibacterales bacterium]|nr:hypothetical protein [Vicinamibacterales bacterium]
MFRRFDLGLVRLVSAAVAVLVFAQTATLPATQDPPLPSGRDILAKHVKAIGGEAPYKAVKSIRASGRFEMPAQQISGEFEMMAARPNKQRVKVTVSGIGEIESGYDGKVGWRVDPMSGPALLTGKELSEAADDAFFDGALYGPDFVGEATTVGKQTFEGRPAYKVKIVLKSGNERFEYFDAETGLQIGSETTRATPMGMMPVVSVLRDYRKFGALMMPASLTQRLMGVEQVVNVNTYEYDTVPATAFDLPPAIKALIK